MQYRFHIYLMAAAVGVLGCASQAQAGLITNGTFTNGSGQPSLAGWNASSSGVNAASEASYASCCGGQNTSAADLAAFGSGQTSGGSLAQTFATVAGQTYTLTFLYGAFGANDPQSLAVSVGNLATSVANSTGSSNFTNLFNTETFLFTALGATSTLTFRDTSTAGSSTDGLLENVAVSGAVPVPEPASLALLAVSAAGVFGVTRRARR